MKKQVKVALFIVGCLLTVLLSFILWTLSVTANAKIDTELLLDIDREIVYLDTYGQEFSKEIDGKNVAKIESIPSHVINAFIATEDKRFYSHKGLDYKGLARAFINNIKSMSFKEGGSTITQQLIKNTHLSGEKTISRKLKELKLAQQLEKKYSKQEILELYLNSIYFGDGCYGIADACSFLFDKNVEQLSVYEGAILAGIVKAPAKYSPKKNLEKSVDRTNVVLNLMKEQGYISPSFTTVDKDYVSSILSNKERQYTYKSLVKKQLYNHIDQTPYSSKKFYVKTNFDSNLQEIIERIYLKYDTNYEKNIILYNQKGEIVSYLSSCVEQNRQSGSILKPLLVYAPSIQEGTVYSCTKIDDVKTDFNGFTPKNYNNIYNGTISVKQSLVKSSNVCAVKLINDLGIDKSVKYGQELGLSLNGNDENMSLALGSTYNGLKFNEIVNAYTVFNDGFITNSSMIDCIKNDKGLNIYKNQKKHKKIFDIDTVEIMQEMLKETINSGTARKLKSTSIPLCAKTGTAGNENGNTDAYTVSFNKEYCLGVWMGSINNGLMPNSYTGGSFPANISAEIWEEIYKNKTIPDEYNPDNCLKINIDKISYDDENKVVVADEVTPKNYYNEELFTKKHYPKQRSNRFSSPTIKDCKLLVNNNEIQVRLCEAEYQEVLIYRSNGNTKKLVFDSKYSKNKNLFIDRTFKSNETYVYSIIPYYENENRVIFGKEIVLGKIKAPIKNIGDNWINWLE